MRPAFVAPVYCEEKEGLLYAKMNVSASHGGHTTTLTSSLRCLDVDEGNAVSDDDLPVDVALPF